MTEIQRVGTGMALLVALSLVPVRQRFVAEWRVQVQDDRASGVPDWPVSENWANYTYQLRGLVYGKTDSNGLVVFPAVSKWAPVGYWVGRAAWSLVDQGAHHSLGVMASVNTQAATGADHHSESCSDDECLGSVLRSSLTTR